MNGALLVTRELEVGRGRPLLRQVSLSFAPGECWFVLGPNGAGKTTLLATLFGLQPPCGGRLDLAPAINNRSGLGFVPQELRFQPSLPMTVTEFVELGLEGAADRRDRGPRVLAALRAMHIEPLAARDAGALSLGQRRRVLVARALARRPLLLVLDEPTANLDPQSASRLGHDLERLRADRGTCLVHASHDLELARRHATHVALVADGRVVGGPAATLWARADACLGGGSEAL
ncbi:MAG: ABC transporter ATP-binding protein [Planctomycetes bacterium]|nr:ABC transporter ATP-binding protein [Planctomycetota bacterium]